MGCGASAKKNYKVGDTEIAVGERYIFIMKDPKLETIYTSIDNAVVVVKSVDKTASWPIQIEYLSTGKDGPCQPYDLNPIGPEHAELVKETEEERKAVESKKQEVEAKKQEEVANKATQAPKASAPAPKASAPAPKAKSEPNAKSEPEAKSEAAPPVEVSAAATNSCSYMTKDGKEYTWAKEESLTVLAGEKVFLVASPADFSSLTIVLSPEEKVMMDFSKGSSKLSQSPWGPHCVQQVVLRDQLRLRQFLTSNAIPFDESSLAEAAAKQKATQEKKAREALAQLGEDFKNGTVSSHNAHRNGESFYREGIPDLIWSDECYILAKIQVEECSTSGKLSYGNLDGPSGKHGQNLYQRGSGMPYPEPEVVTGMWAAAEERYDWGNHMPQQGTDKFAQIVWRGTTHVAMATSECGNFMVANYFPAGPQASDAPDYKQNVVPRTTRPEVFADQSEVDGDTLDPAGCMQAAKLLDARGNVKTH